MSVERDEIAVSGFALPAMTMKVSVESFVKIRPNSFDSTNSFHNLCSNHRGTEVTEERQIQILFLFLKQRERSSLFFSSLCSLCLCGEYKTPEWEGEKGYLIFPTSETWGFGIIPVYSLLVTGYWIRREIALGTTCVKSGVLIAFRLGPPLRDPKPRRAGA